MCPFPRSSTISSPGVVASARLRSSAAIDAFEHAVMVYRVGLIRAMVDEEKLSFSEVGRRMGVSRQMIARLYRYDEWPGPDDVVDVVITTLTKSGPMGK